MVSEKGYYQVIENLVFQAINRLQSSDVIDETWQPLVDVINVCASTYNIEPKQILEDYSDLLRSTLLQVINV
jgi:hypothetical protein